MTEKSSAIAHQIDRLDHPDAKLQDEVLAQFSRNPDAVRPVVLANLPIVNARIRRALLRWLGDVLTQEVTLPLMRYVFDERGTIAEQTGRSMAMGLLIKRARVTDSPEERGQLRGFAEDMLRDDDPDIRRRAIEILALVGTGDSIPFLEKYAADEDEEVRRAAKRTIELLDEVSTASGAVDEAQWPAKRLYNELIQSAGPRRRQLLRRWRRHDERAQIAVEILRKRGPLREEALRILVDNPIPEARPFLAGIVLDDPDAGAAALALRLLASLGTAGDARSDETQAIRQALRSPVILSQTAGFAAISAFALDGFADQLVARTESSDMTMALAAAKSLEGFVDASHHELCPELLDSIRTNERRRRQKRKDRDRLHLVAHLMSVLRRIVSPSTIGSEAVHRVALRVLADGHRHQPLRVTGLQLLMASTPPEGLDQFERWTIDESSILLNMIDHADRETARRVAELLERGAPKEMPGLDKGARKLWKSGFVDLGESIVPLLDRSGSPQAIDWMEEIATGDDKAAADIARNRLRDRRSDRGVIDVEFLPDDD